MELPQKQPLMENVVVTSQSELIEMVQKALSRGYGGFFKAFAKGSGEAYYVTILFDRSKVLAAECLLVNRGQSLVGSDAIDAFKSLINRPMVVDLFSLDEIEMKLSIAENVDVYAQTPKIPLEDLTGGETVGVSEEKPAVSGAATSPQSEMKSGAKIPVNRKAIEREVDRFLQKAGVDELAPLTKEKKKEENEVLKARVKPAIETLRDRMNSRLKNVPATRFEWLRLSYKLDGSTVKVNLRASFERLRAPMYMRVSDDDLRNRILDVVDSVVNEVSKEYGIKIELNKADIILH